MDEHLQDNTEVKIARLQERLAASDKALELAQAGSRALMVAAIAIVLAIVGDAITLYVALHIR